MLNEFRHNPKILSKHLDGLKRYIDKSKVLTEPGKIPIQMVEGEDVINEAVHFLNSLKPLPPFELDPNLCASAREHVMDIGPKGLLSYQSSDGTEPEDRISKYGIYVEALGENIDFGPNDAMGVIVSLTLDDGEEERPHRDNLFKSDYRKIGIACGTHKTEYQMCVMDFAYDFLPLESKSETTARQNFDPVEKDYRRVMNNNQQNNVGLGTFGVQQNQNQQPKPSNQQPSSYNQGLKETG